MSLAAPTDRSRQAMSQSFASLTLCTDGGEVICERCFVGDTARRRLRGLLGLRELPRGQGIVLRPAWSIHTAFMRFPIDVLFLDSNQVIKKLVSNLRPWRATQCLGAKEVVELAAGEIERRGLEVDSRVVWEPAISTVSSTDSAENGSEPARIRVLLASSDDRYVQLARFLLERSQFVVEHVPTDEDVLDFLALRPMDVLVLDSTRSFSSAARTAAAAEALHPNVSVFIVDEDPVLRAAALPVQDKWDSLYRLGDLIERAYVGEADGLEGANGG
jgi:uncharacterized membrane protein (UPF0127 family)